MRKLCQLNDRGETLVETLAAVLVAAVAIVMLTSSIVGAARLNSQAERKTEEIWGVAEGASTTEGELTRAEKGDGYGDDRAEKIEQLTIRRKNEASQQVDVSLSGGDHVTSYVIHYPSGGDE